MWSSCAGHDFFCISTSRKLQSAPQSALRFRSSNGSPDERKGKTNAKNVKKERQRVQSGHARPQAPRRDVTATGNLRPAKGANVLWGIWSTGPERAPGGHA
jgi:hypothetical protein